MGMESAAFAKNKSKTMFHYFSIYLDLRDSLQYFPCKRNISFIWCRNKHKYLLNNKYSNISRKSLYEDSKMN